MLLTYSLYYMGFSAIHIVIKLKLIIYYSFFFWMNTLTFAIWRLFTTKRIERQPTQREKLCQFLQLAVFSQGLPFIICTITLVVDSQRPGIGGSPYFPNMGEFRCFLGDIITNPRISYFESAIFLYFHLE